MQFLLLISVFVIATCGLIYELVAGTLASYLLGDSVTQFSTVIGIYLFAMGIGSWLSRFIKRNLLGWFVQVEILVGVVGGISSTILFIIFPFVDTFGILLYALVGITGMLVGIEIPLLLRILKDRLEFSELVSRVFTFDYIGALLASLIFPLVLVPYLGLVKTSYLFGILNVSVAIVICYKFSDEIPWLRLQKTTATISVLLLLLGFMYADRLMEYAESSAYPDKVIYATSTRYQRIVITRGNDLRLFLNGNLQFSSADEYRYHEALVHPGLAATQHKANVLVLGGGDGLAVREVLKYPDVRKITLVDLDPGMTDLFIHNPLLSELNERSLSSDKLTVINADALRWVTGCTEKFDFIIVDFPDPANFSVGKLYTRTFYQALYNITAPGGFVAVQSTSPYFAKKSFWCIETTMRDAGFKTFPYHVNVPSFGEWGYVLAGNTQPYSCPAEFPQGLKFMDAAICKSMFEFPKDMLAPPQEVNRLNNQILVHLFEDEWSAVQ